MNAEDTKFHRQLDEKIEDDKDFLKGYGEIRTRLPSVEYKKNWEIIWGNRGKDTPNPS